MHFTKWTAAILVLGSLVSGCTPEPKKIDVQPAEKAKIDAQHNAMNSALQSGQSVPVISETGAAGAAPTAAGHGR